MHAENRDQVGASEACERICGYLVWGPARRNEGDVRHQQGLCTADKSCVDLNHTQKFLG